MRSVHVHAYLLAFIIYSFTVVCNSEDSYTIGAYLPDYRFYINVNETALGLTDLYLFSVDLDPSAIGMFSGCCLQEDHYRIVEEAKSYKQEQQGRTFNTWLTIGGAGRSAGFSKIYAKPEAFFEQLIKFTKKHRFHGIIFDCEQFLSQDEYTYYNRFLLQSANELHKYGLKIAVSIHAGQRLPKQIYRVADNVHLMAYDMNAEYHAHFDAVSRAVDKLVQDECPATKIVLGIPAYARHLQNPGSIKTFAEIVDNYGLDDEIAERGGFAFDSPKIVRQKALFATEKGLAGVFLWEAGQDKQTKGSGTGELLAAMSLQASTIHKSDEL